MLYSNKKRVDEICDKIHELSTIHDDLLNSNNVVVYRDGSTAVDINKGDNPFVDKLIIDLANYYEQQLALLHQELKEL